MLQPASSECSDLSGMNQFWFVLRPATCFTPCWTIWEFCSILLWMFRIDELSFEFIYLDAY